MATAHFAFSATVLANGQVLVTGGVNASVRSALRATLACTRG